MCSSNYGSYLSGVKILLAFLQNELTSGPTLYHRRTRGPPRPAKFSLEDLAALRS